MSGRLKWDEVGKHYYTTGVNHGVLYNADAENNGYKAGVAWNGLTAVNENPSGGEVTSLYADNIEYLQLLSVEKYGFTIEAYYSPEEFDACDGVVEPIKGMMVHQQERESFGFVWETIIGNDTKRNKYGKAIHIAYNCLAQPSEKAHSTVNESPEAATLSWTVNCTPVEVTDHDPTCVVTIDCSKLTEAQIKAIEDVLYGSSTADARLPLPDEIATILRGAVALG